MHSSVFDWFRRSNLKNIECVARRGITHVAFTLSELKDLTDLPGIEFYLMNEELERSMTVISKEEMHQDYQRMAGRKTELLLKKFKPIDGPDHYQEVLHNGKKKLILRLLLNPEKIEVDSSGRCTGIEFSRNKLQGGLNE